MVSYEDVGAAIDWLKEAFGFRESDERFSDAEGRVTQAELSLDGATVMLGWPGADYRSPKRHAQECEQAARWLATKKARRNMRCSRRGWLLHSIRRFCCRTGIRRL